MKTMKLKKMVAALVAALSFVALAGVHTLDLRGSSSAGRAADGALRLRHAENANGNVLRRTDLAAGVTQLAPLEVGEKLVLQLFDDVTTTLTLSEKLDSGLGGTSFLATVEGTDGVQNAVVHQNKWGLQIDIQAYGASRVYSVFSTAEGVLVKEMQPSQGARKCAPAPKVLKARRSQSRVATSHAVAVPLARATSAASTLVDILVVFDQTASRWVAMNGSVSNFAEVAVQKMNAAIANMGLDSKFRFRLVGVEEIEGACPQDAGESLDQLLNAITHGWTWNGYKWGTLNTMRKQANADIVCILTDTGSDYGITGSGFSLDQENASYFADSAFNCCSIRSVASGHTMTHEVGHNMGAGHSDQMREISNRGPQYFSYSSAYYFAARGTKYYTIMGYNTDGYGNYYTEVPYFSSPNHTYLGVAVGDATHDNTRTIAATFTQAAAWSTGVSGDTGTDAFVIKEASVYNGVLTTDDYKGFVGTIQVKAGKANSRTGESKLTATIQLASAAKKISLKGTYCDGAADFAGEALNLSFTGDLFEGQYGEYSITGVKDHFSVRDKDEKAAALKRLAQLKAAGVTALAWQEDASSGWNTISITLDAKGKAKAMGVLADGTKVSLTSQTILSTDEEGNFMIPLLDVKKSVAFLISGDLTDTEELEILGFGEDAEVIIGDAANFSGAATFQLDSSDLATLLGDDTYADYFPSALEFTTNGKKWTLPRAGSVTIKNGVVDTTKLGTNPSALKLTYKTKDGTFTGSFKAYTKVKGKPKATTLSVSGLMIEGTGYGTAFIKRVGSIPIQITPVE